VLPSHLRVYVHYHPTYYHFHVHFAHLKLQGPATLAGKAFLLDDIIGEGSATGRCRCRLQWQWSCDLCVLLQACH
jgi:hypothetical protein